MPENILSDSMSSHNIYGDSNGFQKNYVMGATIKAINDDATTHRKDTVFENHTSLNEDMNIDT